MQLTPALKYYCGYSEVYGAELGPLGVRHHKTAQYGDTSFELDVDLFNAERDVFPYPDGYFDLVLACEILEHMLYDPLHLLLESRRVLAEGGRILITTPNIASLISVARALHGYDNPQIHSKYKLPGSTPGDEVQHMREYTFAELGEAVRSAGFEIEEMFTERIADYNHHETLQFFLEQHGYNPANRGEQTYCIAVKRAALPVTRYPEFLYE
jgi:SAM-dependent methyltransferase